MFCRCIKNANNLPFFLNTSEEPVDPKKAVDDPVNPDDPQ
jgi:hypothetical protein